MVSAKGQFGGGAIKPGCTMFSPIFCRHEHYSRRLNIPGWAGEWASFIADSCSWLLKLGDGIDTLVAHIQNPHPASQRVHIPMAKSNFLLLVLFGALLTGCSSLKTVIDYSGPSNAVSTIQFENMSAHGVAAGKFVDALSCDGGQFLQGANAPDASIGVAIENKGRRERFIGMRSGESRTFAVERGKALTVFGCTMAIGSVEIMNCRVQVTFVPKESIYRLAFKTTSGLSKCGFSLQTATGEPVDGVLRPFVSPSFADGPYCAALSSAEKRQLGL